MNSIQVSDFLRLNFQSGKRSMACRKLVHGFGVNDSDYMTNHRDSGINLRCPAYKQWANMIARAHSLEVHKKQPYYIGTSVCDEWRSFMRFRSWWIDNYVEGWQLDKDLLVPENKTYSPDTCIFIPASINSFNSDARSSRGLYPIGVSYHKHQKKFVARVTTTGSCRQKTIGYYRTPEEAYLAWFNRKIELAYEHKSLCDSIDKRLFECVLRKIQSAK